ncbi:MAG: hypothetical protein ACHQT9_01725 [Candidatus Saccharimonadales bacterium]
MGNRIAIVDGPSRQWAGDQPSREPLSPASRVGEDGEKLGTSKRFGVAPSAPRDLGYEAIHGFIVGGDGKVIDTRPPADVETLTDPRRAPIEANGRIIPRLLMITGEVIDVSNRDTGVEALEMLDSGQFGDAVVHVTPHGNPDHVHFQVNTGL